MSIMFDIKSKIYSFFLFNSSFGPKEGQELQRILFFHPSEVSAESRKLQVGLCEAVVKFMSTFSSEPCEALQTQTKRYIFYQPEKGFWLVLVVGIPYTTKAPITNGENHTEIVVPSVIHNFLLSAYRMFKMFVGPLKDIPPEEIYTKCDNFFTRYIISKSIVNDVADVIQGVNYLPLEIDSFFKVLCFMDLVEVNYSDVKCVSFIYNEQLIWNGLSTDNMLTLYQYLIQTLIPREVEKEIQGGALAAAQKHGRYICPPGGIQSNADLEKLLQVNLTMEDETETKQYYLIIYRILSATICFAIDAKTDLQIETFKSMDAFMSPQLFSIVSTISEECATQALSNAQIANIDTKFIYFNRLNLSFRSSSLLNKLVPSTAVTPEVLSIISGIHSDRKMLGNYGEIVIMAPNEYWITGKSSNDREFYVVIQDRNANFKGISEEVRRICEMQMKGIFFYPM